MKHVTNLVKSAFLIAFLVASAALAGCNADALTGPDTPEQAQDCENCSNGHNL